MDDLDRLRLAVEQMACCLDLMRAALAATLEALPPTSTSDAEVRALRAMLRGRP